MVALKLLILNYLPHAYVLVGDDAAKHMAHYFSNSGKQYIFDLQGMIDEVPRAKGLYEQEVDQAKVFVETLPPGTYDIIASKLTSGYNNKIDSKNWFFAVGGYSIWGKAKVVVEKDSAGNKAYNMDFILHCVDRYNWDKGKSVKLFDIEITDKFMGIFHKQGIAQEFNLRGKINNKINWGDKTVLAKMEPESSGR